MFLISWCRRLTGATLLVMAGAGTAATPLSQPPSSVYRPIKDWTLVCDNTRYCEAKGLVEGNHATMRIEREAGPNTPINLVIDALGELHPDLLRVDDKPSVLQTLPWHIGGRRDLSETQLSLSRDNAKRALAAMIEANKLSLGASAQNATISLIGLKAVLLSMDELQGRLDTPGALVRTGPLSENRVARSVPLPYLPVRTTVATAIPQGFLATVRTARSAAIASECEQDLQKPNDEAKSLSAKEVLVFLECRRGAYQSQYLSYRVNRDKPQEVQGLVLPVMAGIDKRFEKVLSQPEWDLDTGTLTVGAKGRGVADCGYWAKWRFDGDAFVMAEFHEQRICAGRPWDWPALYRSKASKD
ncbi:DUF1176 domain-containing protein [Pigmentiphaga aceris]|uniref:DUF1176 domain-containing protein n=1 Tax=Pigmentiphaga aceris TaxID=1940612 RepID=A0A5C0B0B7_9BURK|nr:DUF1176 domain-containing protein [Pigmentiphaga aceris]QEI07815.1 DUF1176 domain-containing protein [Pigmentiphaga aceris]